MKLKMQTGSGVPAGAYQAKFVGLDLVPADPLRGYGEGLKWLDANCTTRYGKAWIECAPQQQKEILDQIAYRNNALTDPSISQGIEFFSFLRNITTDGFFTSEIGIKYLGYIGSAFLKDFPGCPPVSGV